MNMKIETFSHRNGQNVVPDEYVQNISSIINNIYYQGKRTSATDIRREIIRGLGLNGWSNEYRLDIESKISITSFRNKIGMCLQTGNVSRIYADLLKLQALFIKDKINAGIIILPQKRLANELASNMANYERLVSELTIFSQVITIPLVIIGFDKEGT